VRRSLLNTFLLVGLVACSGGAGHVVEMPTVHSFDPEAITIKAGESVTWQNSSSEQHTVTADESSVPEGGSYFASGGATSEKAANDDLEPGLMDPGEEFEVTFDTPGTYAYYCILHRSDGMEGTVVVEK
jgi:plastocyanin